MSNDEFARELLDSYVNNNVRDAATRVDIPPATTVYGGLFERMSCYIASNDRHQMTRERLLEIHYRPDGEFSGNVKILQREPVDFANAAEYEAQLDDAFKDAEIVKLIA